MFIGKAAGLSEKSAAAFRGKYCLFGEDMQDSLTEAWQERTELLLGTAATERLRRAHVLVCGAGGVGAYAAEMLVRAGIGTLTLVDADCVQPSNLNRQLPALHSSLGKRKVEVMGERLLDINPAFRFLPRAEFLTPESIPQLLDGAVPQFDFVVDAIDTIAPKCALLAEAYRRRLPLVSSMGAGAKSDPAAVRYGKLGATFQCTLARAVRTRLKPMGKGLMNIPVVFSTEAADARAILHVEERNKKSTCGTISYLPAIFGCYLAAFVLKRLAAGKEVLTEK
jgi:tRNA A37 threonylcarbamoyladenosine dehydratase